MHVHVRAPVSIAPRSCARHRFTQREGRARGPRISADGPGCCDLGQDDLGAKDSDGFRERDAWVCERDVYYRRISEASEGSAIFLRFFRDCRGCIYRRVSSGEWGGRGVGFG